MQVFQTFFKIAKKHITGMTVYFAIYLFIAVALSFSAKSSMAANFQSKALSVIIQDEDHSAASEALCDYLGSLHQVSTEQMSDEQLADRLYYRTLNYVLRIPDGFEESLLAGNSSQLISDIKIPGSTTGFFVDQQIRQYLQTLQIYLSGGFSLTDAISETNKTIQTASAVDVVSFSGSGTDAITPVFYYYQYLPYVFILLLFVGLAPIIVIENSHGIKERTLCSSLPVTKRNLILAAACSVYGLLTWLLFMGMGVILYGKVIFESVSLLGMLNSFVYLLFAVAMTLLISLFAPNNNTLNMLANIIGLSLSFLCGVFVPQNMLSDQVLSVGRFLPAYWYIKANNLLGGFASEPFDQTVYLKCIGIQLLFAAAVFAVTLALSMYRRKER